MISNTSEEVSYHYFFKVYIRSTKTTSGSNECTGTLISEWFVLTAAHCFKERHPTVPVYLYMAKQLRPDIINNKKHDYASSEIYIHEKYSTGNIDADIALLKTLMKVSLSASVRPICLNMKLENTAGDFISAGYGVIEGHQDSDRFKMVEIRMDGKVLKKCQEAGVNNDNFTEKIICVAHPTEKRGGDVGYSGGPLMHRMKHKCPIHEEIAVLSQSNDHDQYELPVLLFYVKIEPYISWIANIVWPDHEPISSTETNPSTTTTKTPAVV
ncbi:coagulation factor X-like [Planococcus citri]|uniref:coagulation factor X-like n=1 Tax=Planococcus citri TaxID=170843 RepID=UPI0031F797B0